MYRLFLLTLGLVLCASLVAQATVTVTAGDHILLPNTAGQVFDVLIRADAGEGANAMDFVFQINYDDGFGSGAPAPLVTGLDLNEVTTAPQAKALAGSDNVLFDNGANSSTTFSIGLDPPGLSGIASVALNTISADLPIPLVDSVLVSVEVDTTSVPPGVYPFQLDLLGARTFIADIASGDVPLTFAPSQVNPLWNGSLTIVPEPSSLVLGLFAAAGVAAVVIRRRAGGQDRRGPSTTA